MEFFAVHYGKRYAPNTRETVRRQTVHQFMQAGMIVPNPDKPLRPTNSPKAVYQIEPSALKLLREFGRPGRGSHLRAYLHTVKTLKKLYARERDMRRITVKLSNSQEISLSPGGRVMYVGDTETKWAYFDSNALEELAIEIEEHGKMPDVVVHHVEKNWLVLIEAVTSHGPVNPKRRQELKKLFAGSKVGIVYVTAFLDRKAMMKYLDEISWETEVWIAETPTHLIHFNGERFLGPYED